MKMETFYKVLNVDGATYYGGTGKWYLPVGKRPAKWMPRIPPPLKPCERGYHILKREQLVQWIGPAIFTVEPNGGQVWQGDKGVCERARLLTPLRNWNEQTARLFACDCAASVIPLMEEERSANAIRVSRRYAFGLATLDELAAARAAAWDAARAAAR